MKKILKGLLVIGAVGLLAACSTETKKDAAKVNEDKVIVWAWDETFNVKAVEEAKKAYEDKDVEIEVVNMSQDDIVQKLNTSLASGNTEGLPNIVLIEDYKIQGYLKSYPDAFADLTKIVDESAFSAYKFAVNKVGDKIYGVPFDSGVAGLFYRVDYLAEAGYQEDELLDITWDEYIKIAKDVKEKTGHQMTSLNPSDLGPMRIIMQSAGTWYTDDQGKVTIKDNEPLKEGMRVFAEMLNADLIEQVSDWDGGVNAVQSGNVTGALMGSWYSSSITGAEDQSGKWRIAPIPAIKGEAKASHMSSIGGGGWYVIKGVNGEEKAKDFLEKTFATDSKLIGELADTIGLVSNMKAAETTSQYAKESEFYSGQKVFQDFSKWSSEVPAVNYGTNTYAIEDILTESFQRVINGEDIDKVLADAQKQVEAQVTE